MECLIAVAVDSGLKLESGGGRPEQNFARAETKESFWSELWSAAQRPDRRVAGRTSLDKVPRVVPYVAALENARGSGASGTRRQRATSAGNAAFHVGTPG